MATLENAVIEGKSAFGYIIKDVWYNFNKDSPEELKAAIRGDVVKLQYEDVIFKGKPGRNILKMRVTGHQDLAPLTSSGAKKTGGYPTKTPYKKPVAEQVAIMAQSSFRTAAALVKETDLEQAEILVYEIAQRMTTRLSQYLGEEGLKAVAVIFPPTTPIAKIAPQVIKATPPKAVAPETTDAFDDDIPF